MNDMSINGRLLDILKDILKVENFSFSEEQF
jgi:hypothetical protein